MNISRVAIASLGFIISIFISSFVDLGITFSLLLFFISIIIFIYLRFFVTDENEKKSILFFAIFIVFFAIGIFRFEIQHAMHTDSSLESVINKNILAEGVIENNPEVKGTGMQFIARIDTVKNYNLDSYARVLVSVFNENAFNYGDRIEIIGTLEKPKNFSDGTSTRIFDYVNYLAKDDIYYRISAHTVKIISHDNLSHIQLVLFTFKKSFESKIYDLVSKRQAGLLNGVLLGSKSGISKDTMQEFQISGIPHIVVLSGYNITVVVNSILNSLSYFPRYVGLTSGILGVILFILMTGMTATSVRAGIMALIAIFAKFIHRQYDIGRALILTACIMIFLNPKILVFDISFQLSFLATIAVIYISPIVKEKMQYITDKFKLRDTIATTLSAQIAVLPLILNKMGLLSIVSLPTNILILPIIPYTMFFGFLMGIFGYIFYPFAIICAWITNIFLSYILFISHFFSHLPFSFVMISYFPVWLMIVFYGMIFFWVVLNTKKEE